MERDYYARYTKAYTSKERIFSGRALSVLHMADPIEGGLAG